MFSRIVQELKIPFVQEIRTPTAWRYDAYQGLVFAIPFMMSLIFTSVVNDKLIDRVKFTVSFTLLFSMLWTYAQYFPERYLPPNTDEDKIFTRLFLHTFVVEGVGVGFRSLYKGGQNIERIGLVFFALCFGSVYGRILQSAVNDETLLIVSSVGLGFIEVMTRLTAFQRDALIYTIVNKITGKKGDAIALEVLVARKALLIVTESELEIGSIVFASLWFIFLCQEGGPLDYTQNQGFNKEALVMIGFDVSDYIYKNMVIQIVVEFFTDVSSFFFEVYVVKINPFSTVDKNMSILLVRSYLSVFFFSYTTFFSLSLFYFPVRDHDSLQEGSPYTGIDLSDTWIFVIGTGVQLPYIIDYSDKYFA